MKKIKLKIYFKRPFWIKIRQNNQKLIKIMKNIYLMKIQKVYQYWIMNRQKIQMS